METMRTQPLPFLTGANTSSMMRSSMRGSWYAGLTSASTSQVTPCVVVADEDMGEKASMRASILRWLAEVW